MPFYDEYEITEEDDGDLVSTKVEVSLLGTKIEKSILPKKKIVRKTEEDYLEENIEEIEEKNITSNRKGPWFCDRCGERIKKSNSRCPSCHRVLYWKWDGGLIFGRHIPESIKKLDGVEVKEIKEKWKQKLDDRYKKKGALSYLGYKIFGESKRIDRRRRRATTEEMAEVFRRHGHKCVECDSPYDLTVDHITPLSKGGDWDLGNLRPLCRKCNSSKGNRH